MDSTTSKTFFGTTGRLLPINIAHVHNHPNLSRVDMYARTSTTCLIAEAKRGNLDFELFMKLHRRAIDQHGEKGEQYEWDVMKRIVPGEEGSEEMVCVGVKCQTLSKRDELIVQYDRKWGIRDWKGKTPW